MNRGKPNWEHLDEELHVLVSVEDYENRAAVKLRRATETIRNFLEQGVRTEDMNRGKPGWEHLDEELHVLVSVEDYENRAAVKLRRPKQTNMNRGKPNWEHLDEELHVLVSVEDYENRAAVKLRRATETIRNFLEQGVRT
ncbi:hypothetical protein T265_14662, partial [Opisthorchis viverrini]